METKTLTAPIQICSFDELNDEDRCLVEKAKQATSRSYSPYSNFKVGACVRLANGIEIIGANQENASYPAGICAERTAIFTAQAQYPDQPIVSLAIATRNTADIYSAEPTAPCGICRQVILEIEDRYKQPIRIILYGSKHIYIINSVKDILPLYFVSDSMSQ